MFQFNEDKYYTMPAFFGGLPVRIKIAFEDCWIFSLHFQTDFDLLHQYIPEDFEVIRPELFMSYSQCNQGSWLRDEHVKLCSLSVPVRYKGNEEGLTGVLPLIIWENCTQAIVTIREEAGLPGVYTWISDPVGEGRKYTIFMGEQERPFATLEFIEGEVLGEEEVQYINDASPVRQFGWRYIPNVGAPGAALSHATLCPFRYHAQKGNKSEAKISWHTENFGLYTGQAHILKALSSLPLLSEISAHISRGPLYLKPELSRPLP